MIANRLLFFDMESCDHVFLNSVWAVPVSLIVDSFILYLL